MNKCTKLIAALCLLGNAALAQTGSTLKTAIAAFNQLRDRLPIEKVYVHTDKPYYTLGDTLHFKAYVFNADYFTPSSRSGLLYVELDNEYGRAVKRIMVPVYAGLAAGDIAFSKDEIPEGAYLLRAYTNWMRNFGESYIFKKNLYVSAIENATLVQADFKLDSVDGKNRVQGKLKFRAMDGNDLRLKDMQLRVMSGRRVLDRQKVTTGMDGAVSVSFDLADKFAVNNLAIQVVQKGKNADTIKLMVPVNISRAENTDVQFMPEGGSLVAGIKTKIGFKAIGEDGKAVDVSGKVYDKNQEVVNFKSANKGMGSFEFTPLAGITYQARVLLPGGLIKTYALPPVSAAGTVLRVYPKGTDSLTITVSSAGSQPGATTYNLISQSREVVCYAQSMFLISGRAVSSTIATSLFPTGITRFTLLNAANQALNERQVFINHHDNLQVAIRAAQPVYTTRDSVALRLEVKDKNGEPVQGSFSVAVTDDGQVKTDSLGTNIINNLLFTADLKGEIDQPGYYFTGPAKAAESDNLMLTQGWVGYDIGKVFDPKPAPIRFVAEPEFVVKGKVTNIFGKPVENSNVVLFSKKPSLVLDTLTGKDGIFTFKGFMPIDTAAFQLTSHNKRGKNNNVNIDMLDEFKPPVFTLSNTVPAPWYVNTDTLLLNNSNTKLAQQNAEASFRGEGNRLKEVLIKDKKTVKNSKHLVEPGSLDQVIDEAEILKMGKMTLTELLQKKVKSFQLQGLGALSPFGKPFSSSFIVDRRLVYFIIDGMPVNSLFDGNSMGPLKDPERYSFLKMQTDYITAEDITGIEVMVGLNTAGRYAGYYITTDSAGNPISIPPILAFIEITTRSGHGPYLRHTPGTYLYKPLPVTLPKQFYSPKYTVKNKSTGIGTDLRSAIYWSPHVVTDAAGKGTVGFYTADRPGNYTVLIEGTDLNGNIGHQRFKLTVKPPKN